MPQKQLGSMSDALSFIKLVDKEIAQNPNSPLADIVATIKACTKKKQAYIETLTEINQILSQENWCDEELKIIFNKVFYMTNASLVDTLNGSEELNRQTLLAKTLIEENDLKENGTLERDADREFLSYYLRTYGKKYLKDLDDSINSFLEQEIIHRFSKKDTITPNKLDKLGIQIEKTVEKFINLHNIEGVTLPKDYNSGKRGGFMTTYQEGVRNMDYSRQIWEISHQEDEDFGTKRLKYEMYSDIKCEVIVADPNAKLSSKTIFKVDWGIRIKYKDSSLVFGFSGRSMEEDIAIILIALRKSNLITVEELKAFQSEINNPYLEEPLYSHLK